MPVCISPALLQLEIFSYTFLIISPKNLFPQLVDGKIRKESHALSKPERSSE